VHGSNTESVLNQEPRLPSTQVRACRAPMRKWRLREPTVRGTVQSERRRVPKGWRRVALASGQPGHPTKRKERSFYGIAKSMAAGGAAGDTGQWSGPSPDVRRRRVAGRGRPPSRVPVGLRAPRPRRPRNWPSCARWRMRHFAAGATCCFSAAAVAFASCVSL